MNEPTAAHLCVKHRAIEGDCDRWADTQSDPCKVIDLPIAEALVHVITARRDRMAAGADDTSEWTDPTVGHRFVRHLLAAQIARTSRNTITCQVPRGTSWGYVAGDLLDVEVPGHSDTARIVKIRPYEYQLTW